MRVLATLLAKALYWLAVVVVSVVLLVLLIRVFEARDQSDIDGAGPSAVAVAVFGSDAAVSARRP